VTASQNKSPTSGTGCPWRVSAKDCIRSQHDTTHVPRSRAKSLPPSQEKTAYAASAVACEMPYGVGVR
jgi:hypothetical protein